MKRKNRWLVVCLLTLAIIAVGLLLAFFVTKGLKIPCPVYQLTGILCPGCGNTRATLALLRFDFRSMLQFNLLYPVEVLYIAWIYIVCARNFIKNGAFQYHTRPGWMDIICLCAILIWTVVRNILAA